MARLLSGMAPVTETKIDGGPSTNRRRGRLPELQSAAPGGPQASPVDTYTPVQAPKGAGDEFLQLAQGLRSFSPVLGQFVDQRMGELKQAQEAAAEGKIGGMTPQQQAEFIKSGEIDRWEGPWARARFMQLYGGNAGQQAGLALAQRFETGFDPAATDLEAMIADTYREGLEAVGTDPHAQSQYARSFSQIADRIRTAGTQAKAQDFKVKAADQVTQTMIGKIAEMGNAPTADTFAALRKIQKDNATTGLMTMQDGDKVLMDVARRVGAEGNAALAQEILFNNRDGVGALGNKAENLTASVSIAEAARSTSFEMAQRGDPAAMQKILEDVQAGRATPEQIEDGVRQGLYGAEQATQYNVRNNAEKAQAQAKLAALQEKQAVAAASEAELRSLSNEAWGAAVAGEGSTLRDRTYTGPDGNPRTYTVSDQEKDNIKKWRELQDQRTDLTPAGRALNDSKTFFAPNGYEDKELQQTLSAGAASVTSVDIQKGLPPLDKALAAYDQWRAVYSQLPMYAERNLLKDEPTRRFYEDVRIGIELRGLTREEAMGVAIRNAGKDWRRSANLSKDDFKAIREAADDAIAKVDGSSLLGRLWNGTSQPTNIQNVREDIEKLAQANMDSAASPQLAIQAAVDQYARSHINVNGRSVLANSKAYPENMGQVLTDRLKVIFDENGGKFRGIEDFADMGVVPDLSGAVAGRWVVIDPAGLPVTVPGKGPLYITMDDINAQLELNRTKAAADSKAVADRAAAQQRANQEFLALPQTVRRATPRPVIKGE